MRIPLLQPQADHRKIDPRRWPAPRTGDPEPKTRRAKP